MDGSDDETSVRTKVHRIRDVIISGDVSDVDDGDNTLVRTDSGSESDIQSSLHIAGVSGGSVYHGTAAGVVFVEKAEACPVVADKVVVKCQSSPTKRQTLKNKTERRLKEWTKDMIHTEATQTILDKISQGLRWITISGNPGEGKTTAAYLALKHYHGIGKQVYDVQTLEDYEAVKDVEDAIIMLDDIFGQFKYSENFLDKWNAVMNDVLKMEEHSKVFSSGGRNCTILVISRSNVLRTATPFLGKYKKLVLRKDSIVDLSQGSKSVISEDQQRERMHIWHHHASRNKIDISENTVEKVCRMKISHGFPHCCKLFAEKFYNENVDMEAFFQKPMDFLKETMEAFIEDKEVGPLLCQILKRDGAFDLESIEDADKRLQYKLAVRRLEGSYLSTEDDVVSFKHPSIYDSTAFVLCTIDPKFVIQNCSLSFLNERIQFDKLYSPDDNSSFRVHIHQKHIQTFIERLSKEISERNLQFSLAHESFHDKDFVLHFTESIMQPADLKTLINLRDKATKNSCLFLSSSSQSDKILIYICSRLTLSPEEQQDCLFGICENSSVPSMRFFLRTFDAINLNCRNDKSQTPLLLASTKCCDQMLKLLLAKDVDVTGTDDHGYSALHHVCENGVEGNGDVIRTLVKKGASSNLACNKHPSLPLHIASFNGHLKVVMVLIECGADVSTEDDHGTTSLHYACVEGHGNIVSILLDKGAVVDINDNQGSTPLQGACYWGHTAVVTVLLNRGADVNRVGLGGRTPIYDASQRGHVNIVSCLLNAGADINYRNKSGSTPLQEACYEGQVDVVSFLVEHQADINTRDSDGRTPLHVACYRQKVKIVTLLLERGADMNLTENSGKTPLHYVCFGGQEAITSLLLGKGADVDQPCGVGMTCLHYASYNGHIRVVKLLLGRGANVNKTTSVGASPLHFASQSGNDDLVGLLLEKKADINKPDDEGRTALHEACYRGYLKTVNILLRESGDINMGDTNGRTPLHDACLGEHLKIANLLLKNGADVNKEDATGATPLHYACSIGRGKIVPILLTKDADVIKTHSSGNTSLHFACQNDGMDTDIVQSLLVCIDKAHVISFINMTNAEGNTPLHLLCESQNPCTSVEDRQKLAEFLIKSGADPDLLNREGKTALHGLYRELHLEKV